MAWVAFEAVDGEVQGFSVVLSGIISVSGQENSLPRGA